MGHSSRIGSSRKSSVPSGETGRLGDAEAVVHVNAKHDGGAERTARGRQESGGEEDVVLGAEYRRCVGAPSQPEAAPADGEGLLGIRDECFGVVGTDAAEGGDARPAGAAQQPVHRHVEHLACEIMERDVDGRDQSRSDAVTGKAGKSVEVLPHRRRAQRVATLEIVAEVGEAPAIASSRLVRPDSPQPVTPQAVATLTRSWF